MQTECFSLIPMKIIAKIDKIQIRIIFFLANSAWKLGWYELGANLSEYLAG